MTVKSNKEITLEELARVVAESALDSASFWRESWEDIVMEGGELSEEQKKEILMLVMFATVHAVSDLERSITNKDAFFEKFHLYIYNKVGGSTEQQISFENLIQDRYKSYYLMITDKEELKFEDNKELQNLASSIEGGMWSVGAEFATNFLGREITELGTDSFDPIQAITASQIAAKMFETEADKTTNLIAALLQARTLTE